MSGSQDESAAVRSAEDLTGTVIGRFQVVSRLGTGGMGEVYRAQDTRLKRTVALKRVAPRLGSDPLYRERFLKEAERASALNDPRIAGVYDVFEEKGELYLVMSTSKARRSATGFGSPSASSNSCRSPANAPKRCARRTRRTSCTATSSRRT